MKIVHLVAGIQETCGVSQFVVNVAHEQQTLGHEVTIVTTMTCGYPTGDLTVVLTERPCLALARVLGGGENSKRTTTSERRVVHLHSMWTMYAHQVAVWCRRNGIPYVFSPHGSMTPWAMRYKWWKKIPAWWLYQRADFKGVAGFHVTVVDEEQDVRRLGFKQPVVIAPLGCRVAKVERVVGEEKTERRDVLFLGRIHPKKNVDGLIRAWALLKANNEDGTLSPCLTTSRLIVAGSNDVGWQDELVALAQSLKLTVVDFSHDLEFGKKQITGGGEVPVETFQKRLAECDADVVFTGPVYSAARDWMYRHAWVSVLPSHSENFGGVVVESLTQGTPVIASKGTPWKVLEDRCCGWWVDAKHESLMKAMITALTCVPSERQSYSQRAKDLVQEQYSWENSARTVIGLYEKIA